MLSIAFNIVAMHAALVNPPKMTGRHEISPGGRLDIVVEAIFRTKEVEDEGCSPVRPDKSGHLEI